MSHTGEGRDDGASRDDAADTNTGDGSTENEHPAGAGNGAYKRPKLENANREQEGPLDLSS